MHAYVRSLLCAEYNCTQLSHNTPVLGVRAVLRFCKLHRTCEHISHKHIIFLAVEHRSQLTTTTMQAMRVMLIRGVFIVFSSTTSTPCRHQIRYSRLLDVHLKSEVPFYGCVNLSRQCCLCLIILVLHRQNYVNWVLSHGTEGGLEYGDRQTKTPRAMSQSLGGQNDSPQQT